MEQRNETIAKKDAEILVLKGHFNNLECSLKTKYEETDKSRKNETSESESTNPFVRLLH